MSTSVLFDEASRTFVLRLAQSAYIIRLAEDNRVFHSGFVPLPAETAQELSPENLANYPDANYVWEPQAQAWEYPTFGDISLHETALKVAFETLPTEVNAEEAPHLPVRDLRLRYESHKVVTDAQPLGAPTHGQPSKVSTPRETLALCLKDQAYDFTVTLYYRLTPECDVMERWVDVQNQTSGNVVLEHLDFATLALPPGPYELTRAAGTWAREFMPATQRLEQGCLTLDHRGINTGHFTNPFFHLHAVGEAVEESGTVYFGVMAWSGNWRMRFETLPTGPCRIFAGYEASDFELVLKPGESHTTSACVLGCSAEGHGGASRRLHAFILDRVLPGHDEEEFRPILYNSWEASYFDLSFEQQLALAKKAASIGVELFVVDDGWFGARRDDSAGLGDWVVSPDVFPDGLQPLADEVHQLGMKFGLWVEPEMVNVDSDLYRLHPDWVLHFPGRQRSIGQEYRNQLILDFGRPEVVAYILELLDALVRENGVDFFKWDMNRYVTEPGSVAGRGIWRKHVEGLYHIMDELRRRHPHLSIQSCSGGGGRIDAGILARCDQAWTSDNTDARDRTYIEEGFSLAYPPRAMESWVTHATNHQTGMSHSLDLRFDVAMRGNLGIGTALDRLSDEELAIYERKIRFYRRIRPVVQGGRLYRLTSVQEAGCSFWLTVLPDASRAVYSAVVLAQFQGTHFRAPRLLGLDPQACYRVIDEFGEELASYPGWQLMSLGLPGDSEKGGFESATRSRTVLLEKIAK